MLLASPRTRPSWMPKYVPRAGDGCVLWLPGQDDAYSATIRDRSGKGNHGAITGATWARTAKGLWYLYFDGDDYVDCGDGSSLDLTAACTLYVWVDKAQVASDNVFLGKDNSYRVYFPANSMGPTLYITTDGEGGGSVSFGENISENVPICLCWTYDKAAGANNVKTYINAVAKATATRTLDLTASVSHVFMGAYATATDNTTGKVMLGIIANIAWTAEEIAGHFNAQRHLFGV